MNPIIENLINARKGHYVHAIEVNDGDDCLATLENIVDVFSNEGYSNAHIQDFINTLEVYSECDEAYEVWRTFVVE